MLDETHRDTYGETDRHRGSPARAAGGYGSAKEHRVDSDDAHSRERVNAYGGQHGSRRISP